MGVMNALLERMKWMKGFGTTFGGARDLYAVYGYKQLPMHKDFVFKYRRQDIARRIIHAPVDATWTDPPLLKVGASEWTDWTKLAKEHDIWMYLHQADIFAGLGIFSILVVGMDDGSLSTPVRKGKAKKILYLQPYLEDSIDIVQVEENQSSPRFGKPVMYEITPGETTLIAPATTQTKTKIQLRNKFQVHWTRVLHLADNTLENSIAGCSRLEPVYNTLDDLQKVCGSAAETFWLTGNRGMHIDIDKEMEMQSGDEEALSDEIDEYQNQLRRVIRTRGVKIANLGSDVADPKNTFSVLMSLLSSATGIPQRVLMGAEAGQLASQQDRANWAIQIAQRVAVFAEPKVLKPFLKLLHDAEVISVPEDLIISWPDPFKMNPLERAQTSAQTARSAVNIIRTMESAQKIGTQFLSIEESREIIAPGDKMPILVGTPSGTFPPDMAPIEREKLDLEKKVQKDAAKAALEAAKNPPEVAPQQSPEEK